MGNRVVHFEVAGPDAAALAKFYVELFGWGVREIPDADYFLTVSRANPVARTIARWLWPICQRRTTSSISIRCSSR